MTPPSTLGDALRRSPFRSVIQRAGEPRPIATVLFVPGAGPMQEGDLASMRADMAAGLAAGAVLLVAESVERRDQAKAEILLRLSMAGGAA